MSLFSPLDTRYSKDLPTTLSEEEFLTAQVEVEASWLLTLAEAGLCPKIKKEDLDKAFDGLSFEEIEEIEKRTQHATRALVEALANRLTKAGREDVAKWVHVGITSFDTVDTAYRLRLKKFIDTDWSKEATELKSNLTKLGIEHVDTKQVGRTHGQWAVPSVFGLSLLEFAYRLERSEKLIESSKDDLCGQASGAIGGYHASAMLSDKPLELEKTHLKNLKLKEDLGSLQIIAPEDYWALASNVFAHASVVAKAANDLRHLARSEIAEISEGMAPGQVGSSTMPQKRNPWNLEHVCSLYKILQSRLNLIQMDMVTEHQRDLTNSASGRFYSEFFALSYLMIKRMNKILSRIEIHKDGMQKNLDSAGSSVFAEAFYIALTKDGVENAHSVVREGSREAEKTGKELLEVLHGKGLLKDISNTEELRKILVRGVGAKIEALKKSLCVE